MNQSMSDLSSYSFCIFITVADVVKPAYSRAVNDCTILAYGVSISKCRFGSRLLVSDCGYCVHELFDAWHDVKISVRKFNVSCGYPNYN